MSRSGVGLSSDCVSTFDQLKLGKNKEVKYIIYKLSTDLKTIEVEKTGNDSDYDAFLKDLPEDKCRYAIYDFDYELPGGEGKRYKICFYTWSPDEASVKEKMIYSSSKDALRRALTGIASEIQGTDSSEVAYETVLDKVSRGTGNH